MKMLPMLVAGVSGVVMAAEPATRPVASGVGVAGPRVFVVVPRTAAVPIDRGTQIDPRGPAFVPKFAQVRNPPAGPFAERAYANRFTDPAPAFGYGWGFGGYAYGFGFGGYGGRSWGSTNSFYR